MLSRSRREHDDHARARQSVYRAPASASHEAFVRVATEREDGSTYPTRGRRVHAVRLVWATPTLEVHSAEVEIGGSDDSLFYAGNLGTQPPPRDSLHVVQQIDGRWFFDHGKVPCEDLYVRTASRYRDYLRLPWFNFCTRDEGTDELYLCCDTSSESTEEDCCRGSCDACEFGALNPHTWEFTITGCVISGDPETGEPPDPNPMALTGTWRVRWVGNCHWSNGGDGVTTPSWDFQFNYVSGCWELYGTWHEFRVGYGTAIVTGFFPSCCGVGILDCQDATLACSMDVGCDYSCSNPVTMSPVTLRNGCDLVGL